MPKLLTEETSKHIFLTNILTTLGTEIEYFTLSDGNSAKVLQASSVSSIVIYDYNGSDNQLWYFDTSNSQLLRNKAFPAKVKKCLYNQVAVESN